MKFFCEYCGNRIDAEKDSKCPNCGASYKKNKSFIKLEEEKKEQIQTNQEYVEKVFKHVFGIFKFSRILFALPILIFIIVIVVAIIITVNTDKKDINSTDNLDNSINNVPEIFEDYFEQEENKQEEVVVNFNEFAETKEYKVKVTKYEKEKDIFNRLEDGYEYIKFYLLVENLTDKELTKADVNCVVDSVAQTNEFSPGYSDLPMFINKGLTVKGTATFAVPENTTSYEIKYGDYVTIKIQK